MTYYNRQQSDDRNMQEMQSTLERTLKDMPTTSEMESTFPFTSEIVQGNLIEDVTISSQNPTFVEHDLGRAWKGWTVVNLRQTTPFSGGTPAVVQHDTVAPQDPEKNVPLTVIGPVFPAPIITAIVSLWIF